MKILGIDPGTAIVGWAVVEASGSSVKSIAFGHITTAKTLSPEKRLQEIRSDLVTLLKRYRPEEGAVEDIFFFNNQKTAMAVSQARGVILLTLSDFGLKLSSYTPLQVKHALTNYGRADKKQVQQMVKTILKLSKIPEPDDTADALAIAVCHASHRRFLSLSKK